MSRAGHGWLPLTTLRQTYDIMIRSQTNDVTSPLGFLTALRDVLRCKSDYKSLVWCGVPCSRLLDCIYAGAGGVGNTKYFTCPAPLLSWVWLSSSRTKRSSAEFGIDGDPTVHSVLTANCIASRTCLLLLVATALKVFWVDSLRQFSTMGVRLGPRVILL